LIKNPLEQPIQLTWEAAVRISISIQSKKIKALISITRSKKQETSMMNLSRVLKGYKFKAITKNHNNKRPNKALTQLKINDLLRAVPRTSKNW
jgi:hypothetical protein